MATLAKGTLAYIDSFSGLVKCRVLAVKSQTDIQVEVTATRAAYKRGDKLSATVMGIVPREAVRGLNSRSFLPRIMPYGFTLDATPAKADIREMIGKLF